MVRYWQVTPVDGEFAAANKVDDVRCWIAAFGVAWRLLDARCDDMSLM